MSHSRTVSPLPNGRWDTADRLTERASTPNGLPVYAGTLNYHNNDDQWAAAKARSAQVRGYPSVQTKNEGFFQRSKRKISTLPVFSPYTPLSANWKDPEKLGRSRWYPRGGGGLSRVKTFAGNVIRRFKFLFIILSIVTLTTVIVSQTSESQRYSRPCCVDDYTDYEYRCPKTISWKLPPWRRKQVRHCPWSK